MTSSSVLPGTAAGDQMSAALHATNCVKVVGLKVIVDIFCAFPPTAPRARDAPILEHGE